MVFESLNLLAVVVSAIISMVIGGLWYSPILFGKQWIKISGFSKTEQERMKKKAKYSYSLMFIGALVTAIVLSFVVDFAGATTFLDGLLIGVLVWLGFVTTTQMGVFLWEGKPKSLYALNTFYSLVNLAIIGGVLAVWV